MLARNIGGQVVRWLPFCSARAHCIKVPKCMCFILNWPFPGIKQMHNRWRFCFPRFSSNIVSNHGIPLKPWKAGCDALEGALLYGQPDVPTQAGHNPAEVRNFNRAICLYTSNVFRVGWKVSQSELTSQTRTHTHTHTRAHVQTQKQTRQCKLQTGDFVPNMWAWCTCATRALTVSLCYTLEFACLRQGSYQFAECSSHLLLMSILTRVFRVGGKIPGQGKTKPLYADLCR